jgi:ABC-type multidrug transport system fused ATPase/permease subunit
MYNNFKKIFLILEKKDKITLTLIIFALLIGVFLETLSLAFVIPVFNFIFLENTSDLQYLNSLFKQFFLQDVLFFKIFILFTFLCTYIFKNFYLIYFVFKQNYFLGTLGMKFSNDLLKYYLRQDYFFFSKNKSPHYLRTVINDVTSAKVFIITQITLFTEFLFLIFLSALLIYYNFYIYIFCLILFSGISLVYLKVIRKKVLKLGNLRQNNLAEMQKNLIECFSGIKDIIVYSLQGIFLSKFSNFNKDYNQSLYKFDSINSIPRYWLEIICIFIITIPILMLLVNGNHPKEYISIFTLYSVAIFKFLPSVNKIISNIQSAKFNKLPFEDIYNFYLSSKNDEINTRKNLEKNIIEFNSDILFKNVSFSYGRNYVLKDINLKIKKNENLLLIGQNGSGKSTFLNLISGLSPVTNGKIIIDNKNNLSTKNNSWKSNVSYVQQDVFLFNDTIKSNIAIGNKDKTDFKKLNFIIDLANLRTVFKNFPKGINTIIKSDASNLSGGQKQIISIARALYKDTNIILFDEPSSSLDDIYSDTLKNILLKIKYKKTIVFITHDASFINYFDKVYEIKNKKLIIINKSKRKS